MKNKYVILGGGGSFAIHTAFYLLKQNDTDSVTGIGRNLLRPEMFSLNIEKEKKYFNVAKQRLKKTIKIEDHYLDTIKNNKSKPRIPFGSLIEMGIIAPGMQIFDPKKKINAKIMADGSIKCNESEGSIHKVAAKIIGAESCNGWTYWHYNLGGAFVPIDNLRQRLISKNALG